MSQLTNQIRISESHVIKYMSSKLSYFYKLCQIASAPIADHINGTPVQFLPFTYQTNWIQSSSVNTKTVVWLCQHCGYRKCRGAVLN